MFQLKVKIKKWVKQKWEKIVNVFSKEVENR
jgi:hypothetical protein